MAKNTTPTKGAGTMFYRLKDDKESTVIVNDTIKAADIKKPENWDRIAKIKELSPGEVSAESYEDNYLDDPNAEWKSTSQGAKSAGETSLTLAWLPGDTAQQALVGDFNTGKKKFYLVVYPNGVRDLNSKLNKITRNNLMAHTRLIAISLSYDSDKSIDDLQKELLTTWTQADIFRVLEAVQDVCEFPRVDPSEGAPEDGGEKNA